MGLKTPDPLKFNEKMSFSTPSPTPYVCTYLILTFEMGPQSE